MIKAFFFWQINFNIHIENDKYRVTVFIRSHSNNIVNVSVYLQKISAVQLTPVFLATQEAEMRKIEVQS
jgi:hypothetical protein